MQTLIDRSNIWTSTIVFRNKINKYAVTDSHDSPGKMILLCIENSLNVKIIVLYIVNNYKIRLDIIT